MSFKVIRNSAGDLLAYGPNDDNYGPMANSGEFLTIEKTNPEPVLTERQKKVPQSVTSVQALTALHNAGLLASVESVMNNPETDKIAVIAYQRAGNFRRKSPFISAVGNGLGLSEYEIDSLFIAAAQID
jgi:hypothetical protein